MPKPGLTEQDYQKAANYLKCEVAAIKAVSEVESAGDAFLPDGRVKILFEPHVFYRELKKRKIDPIAHMGPKTADILYPVQGKYPYGTYTEQYIRLSRASAIDTYAANAACSWGRFQIMGNNYQACGFSDVWSFIKAMQESETQHLNAFVSFIKFNKLDDELRACYWVGFASQYNGKKYTINKYDKKLAAAYAKYKK